MKKQTSISAESWPKVFTAGAFLRWKGEWLVWSLGENSLSTQNQKEISIFSPDFFNLSKGHCKAKPEGVFEKNALSQSLRDQLEVLTTARGQGFQDSKGLFGGGQIQSDQNWQGPSKESFQNSFTKIQSLIASGELQKAVPIVSSTLSHQFETQDLLRAWLNLFEAPDHLIPFGVWNAEGGILGATPEILFVQDDLGVETMALAGTCPKSSGRSVDDFFKDPKENKEHDWVVQDISEKLSSFGQVQTSPKQILELPHLYHLQTKIYLNLKSHVSPFELTKVLHPTAALGVYPSRFNFQNMKSWPEQFDRQNFGAPIVFQLSPKQTVALVAIRGMQWSTKNRQITLRAGCGLVEQSIFESEWSELNQKIDSIRKLILK